MGKVIAVVDDEKKIREMIKSFLHNEGYEVLEAGDGKGAIELAGQQTVDLMLLDIMMPNMDGLQALREIRPMII